MDSKGIINIGNALMLSQEEFEKYYEKTLNDSSTSKEAQEIMEIIRKGYGIKFNDSYFNSDYVMKEFSFVQVPNKNMPDLYFVPLHGDGDSLIPHRIKDISYLAFADWSSFADSSFRRCPYKDYNDLLTEFKLKIAGYISKDFDWDSHIGTILCSLGGEEKSD